MIRRDPAFFLGLSLAVATAVCVVYMAWQQFRLTSRTYDVVYIAQAIENGDRISEASVHRFTEAFLRSPDALTCRSDIVKSAASMLLRGIDFLGPDRDYDQWEKSIMAGEHYIRHALSCLPADGDLWVRLAMLRNAGGEEPTEIAWLMSRSQRQAPSEDVIISARFALWNRLSKRTISLARDALLSDIRAYRRMQPEALRSRGLSMPSTELLALAQTLEPPRSSSSTSSNGT